MTLLAKLKAADAALAAVRREAAYGNELRNGAEDTTTIITSLVCAQADIARAIAACERTIALASTVRAPGER